MAFCCRYANTSAHRLRRMTSSHRGPDTYRLAPGGPTGPSGQLDRGELGLLERIGDARYLLLGEASHGTHEFYDWRARITSRLIAERGFSFVAAEADWPNCERIDRYVKGRCAAARNRGPAHARAVAHLDVGEREGRRVRGVAARVRRRTGRASTRRRLRTRRVQLVGLDGRSARLPHAWIPRRRERHALLTSASPLIRRTRSLTRSLRASCPSEEALAQHPGGDRPR